MIREIIRSSRDKISSPKCCESSFLFFFGIRESSVCNLFKRKIFRFFFSWYVKETPFIQFDLFGNIA